MRLRFRRSSALLAFLLPLQSTGCGLFDPQVRLDRVEAESISKELSAYVLTNGVPSVFTRSILHIFDLQDTFAADPLAALKKLHDQTARESLRGLSFALAEISFLAGSESGDRDHFLAAAVYAYLYLFGEDDPAPADPFDRRFRWACDLYNQSLLRAFTNEKGLFDLAGGLRQLPVGTIEVTVDRSAFPFEEKRFPTFLPADLYRIQGLTLRRRRAGMGAPLIALPGSDKDVETADPPRKFTQEKASLPATAFLRVKGGIGGMVKGLEGALELHSAASAAAVSVAGRRVPLEADDTGALAASLGNVRFSRFWFDKFFGGENARHDNRIVMFQPYEPGRVPIVFVHGTASSLTTWAEMFNALLADPVIRERCQIWFFEYTSGNPILYSAASLRDALRETVAALDPGGTDAALQRMVIIGHSQGGLLTKLEVVDGGEPFWRRVMGMSIEELELEPEAEALVRRVFYFQALPFVRRVVFIATPHRGSFLADRWYSRLFSRRILVTGEVRGLMAGMAKNEAKLPAAVRRKLPTSLDNMEPGSAFTQALLELPIVHGVATHSIIAIGEFEKPEGANDGVVEYSSAHIDGAGSECLVGMGHSCLGHPRTIQEVRRILRLHLMEPTEPAAAAAAEGTGTGADPKP